ncbi:MAG: hypothetical protein ACPGXZ_11420 [Saprospiraceae bacterium]
MKKNLFIILLITICYTQIWAQSTEEKKGFEATTFNLTYATQFPAGDMSRDFNLNFNFGGGIQYFSKSRWILGAEGGYMFGNDPKVDVLANMRTIDGEILSSDRTYGIVFQEERGFYIGLLAGKLIPISKKYPNSGLRLTLSAGFLQHKIFIEDRGANIPQLTDEYIKGYDRLTNGFALTQFIGYQHFGNKGRINFFAGLEFTQGFTKNRRSWDFFAQQRFDENRIDLLNGIRIGWALVLVHDSYDADEILY